MTKKNNTARMLGLLALLLILVGCQTQTPAPVQQQPTPDLGAVRTEAAQTVVVKITLEAALNPSATPEAKANAGAEAAPAAQATATPMLEPTATTAAPTATLVPTSTRQSPPNNAIYPTRTVRTIPDAAVIISSSPEDGASYNSGEAFDAVWKVKNTGTTTWTTDYHIRYARGADMAEAERYYLNGEVKPGETVDLVADMVAPGDKGVQVGYWEFVNGNGDIIFRMYVAINVK